MRAPRCSTAPRISTTWAPNLSPWSRAVPLISDETLRKLIRDVPDFPQPGIIFKDITPLLADKAIFKGVVEKVCRHWLQRPPDVATAIEARQLIPRGPVAL